MKAHHHQEGRPIDPVTGYDTTGHEWGPIRELNTPFPRIALVALALAVAYSVVAWVLLPTWPTPDGPTPGLWKADQGREAVADFRAMDAKRQQWMAAFATPDFAAIEADGPLMAEAMPAAARLFQDNCAACHGAGGRGGPGFPALDDADWLWGGDPATVAETITHGINAADPDTRSAEMPSFDWMEAPERRQLAEFVATLPSGKADWNSPAAQTFADNCTACHGDRAEGGLMVGAPSLSDSSFLYGQDVDTVLQTLRHGRKGEMPAWAPRLSGEEINMLALYVARLPQEAAGSKP